MHSNMEPKLNNISTKTSFNDFTPCWLCVIFYHTNVTDFLQNQCYIYVVRLVHICTKYSLLRGFENKWKIIASRKQGIIITQLPNHPSVKKIPKETLPKWTYRTL